MTEAQKLCDEFRAITAPGSLGNTWKWARRVTAALEPLGNSTIGLERSAAIRPIAMFRCADGSRFAYDRDGGKRVWAMPA